MMQADYDSRPTITLAPVEHAAARSALAVPDRVVVLDVPAPAA